MINVMKGVVDNKFLCAWLIVAISTFLCPTTSLSDPRCYPLVLNLENVALSNWCHFVIEYGKFQSRTSSLVPDIKSIVSPIVNNANAAFLQKYMGYML